MEGSLRTPALVRYPGHVPPGQKSNEIIHITDMFTTLLLWSGLQVPKDHVIDGIDQRGFLEGKQRNSNREGFPYWLGSELYGVKSRNFKLVMVEQKTLTDPALPLPNPHLINLDTDPKEREPFDYPYIHTWLRTCSEDSWRLSGEHQARTLDSCRSSVGFCAKAETAMKRSNPKNHA
jgi:arylsulfatase A-like enzyme